MYNEVRVYSMLTRIEEAIRLIQGQTQHFQSPDDFLCSSTGMFTLGGVCMQLILIGENVKILM
ncbi:MAG: antitoxin, partial [Bacteroides sp.]|nr:antitoxin [Bacteroides sp.]